MLQVLQLPVTFPCCTVPVGNSDGRRKHFLVSDCSARLSKLDTLVHMSSSLLRRHTLCYSLHVCVQDPPLQDAAPSQPPIHSVC
jgi:hypothetical protein